MKHYNTHLLYLCLEKLLALVETLFFTVVFIDCLSGHFLGLKLSQILNILAKHACSLKKKLYKI